MLQPKSKTDLYRGMGLAVLAALIWSGNFAVARGIHKAIPPLSLAFYRWATASLILLPFAWKAFVKELSLVRNHFIYLICVSLTGVTLFNSFVYIAGQYSSAINLAIIGTTSSPIMAIILARIFLREYITPARIAGLLICISGILVLISGGSWTSLANFHFSRGDLWVLAAGFFFAVYSVLVRKKPHSFSSLNFLFVVFSLGTIFLIPSYIIELKSKPPIHWNLPNIAAILYLGLGNSVLAFLCWNAAIARLGTARTSLFGNLIPVFSSLEAVIWLNESVSPIQLASFVLVIAGLAIANLIRSRYPAQYHSKIETSRDPP